jgi:hypothetical protein
VLAVPYAPSWSVRYVDDPTANLVGNSTATVSFVFPPYEGSEEPTDGGGAYTINVTGGGALLSSVGYGGGYNERTDGGVTDTFGGLTNGVPYTFTATASNVCGTSGSMTAGPFVPEATVSIAPPGQISAPLGDAYNQQFTATGGNPPYTWSVLSGALPAGLSLDSATGTVSGTPTQSGVFDSTVQAIDTIPEDTQEEQWIANDATAAFILTVGEPPSITSTCPTQALVGSTYSCTVDATGLPNPTFSETGLPSGVTLITNSNSTEMLSGTPAAGTGGTYSVTITALNGIAPDASQTFALTVDEGPMFTAAAPPLSSTPGVAYSYNFTASGFPTPSYSLGASAPSWLAVDSTTGAVSGLVPSGIASFSYSVTANNGVGNAVTAGPFTVTVSPVVTLRFTGSLTYTNSGPVTSGSPIGTVTGTIAIPGLAGGMARVSVTIVRVFGFYIGTVRVSDQGAHLDTLAVELSRTLTRTTTGQVAGIAYGRSYTLNFTV